MSSDWIAILEALYDLERPRSEWLSSVVDRAHACAPDGAHIVAYPYDATDRNRLRFARPTSRGAVTAVTDLFDAMGGVELPEGFVDATFRTRSAGSMIASMASLEERLRGMPLPTLLSAASSAMHTHARDANDASVMSRRFEAFTGFADIQIANGIDTEGHGLWLGMCVPRYESLDAERVDTLSRIAVHSALAWRLRRRLDADDHRLIDGADAVLSPDGRIEEARGTATGSEARDSLSRAVVAMDRARTRDRRVDPQLGLSEWRGLVARRWSLVEVFERDGRRFLVARENQDRGVGAAKLTRREREVALLVSLGLSNKLVAYELGISAATVGVLLHRSMRKLGVRDRDELRARLDESTPPAE